MKKWLNWVALVIVFSVACGFLANWQFSRRESKLASIDLIQRNYELPATAVEPLLSGNKFSLPKDTWKTVSVTGNYLPKTTLLVRNRPNDGQPGFEELVVFKSASGNIFFVSRGWISTGANQDYPDTVPLPDEQTKTIRARILPEEPVLNRTAPLGQIATINVGLANRLTGFRSSVSNGYLRLIDESPKVGSNLKPMPAPSTEEGNNLSYALQWIMFALMATFALIWRIRKDAELSRGEIATKRIRRSDLDAQFEDETTKAK